MVAAAPAANAIRVKAVTRKANAKTSVHLRASTRSVATMVAAVAAALVVKRRPAMQRVNAS